MQLWFLLLIMFLDLRKCYSSGYGFSQRYGLLLVLQYVSVWICDGLNTGYSSVLILVRYPSSGLMSCHDTIPGYSTVLSTVLCLGCGPMYWLRFLVTVMIPYSVEDHCPGYNHTS
jgi:hypothetical protein